MHGLPLCFDTDTQTHNYSSLPYRVVGSESLWGGTLNCPALPPSRSYTIRSSGVGEDFGKTRASGEGESRLQTQKEGEQEARRKERREEGRQTQGKRQGWKGNLGGKKTLRRQEVRQRCS